jgi:hypothetical protein
MVSTMKTWLRLALPFLLLVVAGCGSDGQAASGGNDPRAALKQLRPLNTAQIAAELRMDVDNAPPDVGSPLVLRFGGPVRSNGADRFPSFDWNVSFTGLQSSFSSRVVSTGSDMFVRLGGVDFAVGETTIARMVDQARAARAQGRTGLGALGIDPMATIADIRELGAGTIAGAKVTRYAGTVDRDKLLDQVERLLRNVPAAPGLPAGFTDEQRGRLKAEFSAPKFEIDVAEDHTVRRLTVDLRFTTPVANRKLAGGMTGGKISYRLQYSPLTGTPKISPPANPEPLTDFFTELQRQLAQ